MSQASSPAVPCAVSCVCVPAHVRSRAQRRDSQTNLDMPGNSEEARDFDESNDTLS